MRLSRRTGPPERICFSSHLEQRLDRSERVDKRNRPQRAKRRPGVGVPWHCRHSAQRLAIHVEVRHLSPPRPKPCYQRFAACIVFTPKRSRNENLKRRCEDAAYAHTRTLLPSLNFSTSIWHTVLPFFSPIFLYSLAQHAHFLVLCKSRSCVSLLTLSYIYNAHMQICTAASLTPPFLPIVSLSPLVIMCRRPGPGRARCGMPFGRIPCCWNGHVQPLRLRHISCADIHSLFRGTCVLSGLKARLRRGQRSTRREYW